MIAPGTVLQNRYRVEKQIGQGGMGTVYVATDQRFGSTVALKETLFVEPNLRKAFEREARLLHNLRHPALPKVTDHFNEKLSEGVAEVEGQFLVMEFIQGDDLSALLAQRGSAFAPAEVLRWADQLLDALDYLHTHEPPVVHRDIKPQNLKLTARDQIVLLDFGLAKGTPAQMSRATNTGSVFGYSRNYAPIEQIQGTGTDPRSDLYSLGATLYHLITGAPPPDALTRATAVLNGQPDPLRPAGEVNPQVSLDVADVLASALAQSAAQRPQTASAMRDALRAATSRQTILTGKETVLDEMLPSTEAITENETRLMSAQGATLAGNANDAAAKQTSAFNVTEAGARRVASPTINVPRGASSTTSDAPSVVTRVRPMQTSAPKRTGSRASYIAAGVVVVLLALSALAYAFMHQRAAENLSDDATTQAPAQSTPQPAATAAAADEKRESATTPSLPAPSTPATQQQQRPRNTPEKDAATRPTTDAPSDPVEVRNPPPVVPAPAEAPRRAERDQAGEAPDLETPENPFPRELTPEEIFARRERRRALEEKRRVIREVMREEKRRRRQPPRY